jgi:transcriptional regulator with XRE-family HTH domain
LIFFVILASTNSLVTYIELKNNPADAAVLQLLGERISGYRLNKNLTQAQLAEDAGVSSSTLNRMESGSSAQRNNSVRELRALHLLENISLLISKPATSPIQQVKLAGKTRQRARPVTSASGDNDQGTTWTWDAPAGKPKRYRKLLNGNNSRNSQTVGQVSLRGKLGRCAVGCQF